jgi:hypothetical protein
LNILGYISLEMKRFPLSQYFWFNLFLYSLLSISSFPLFFISNDIFQLAYYFSFRSIIIFATFFCSHFFLSTVFIYFILMKISWSFPSLIWIGLYFSFSDLFPYLLS